MNETMCNVMIYGGIALAVIFAAVAVVLFIRLEIPKVIGELTGSTAKKQIKEIKERGYENVQGSGVSKKDAIKAKDSSGKIEVRDIKSRMSHSEQLTKQGQERYRQAVNEVRHSETQPQKKQSNRQMPGQQENDYETATDILQEENAYEEATDILNEETDYEEATDILQDESTYEEATDILQAEDAYEESTDILTAEDDSEASTDILTEGYDNEASTDILMAEVAEEATDILTTEGDIEEATDILTGESGYVTGRSHTLPAGFTIITDVVVTHTDETI